ncbi:kinetochore protein fta7 [Purpureocillium lavendulum]|uniref:Kinetochore protein fta7 n=1 Tax=Purpureocillium lavendulum TaxID=1247861 RepID=A0AB34FRH7_9HYPO|nr:kinetochore protein fta7 [Purpureocillium lavendulum]
MSPPAQAPDSPAAKRKRGRPPHASKASGDASHAITALESRDDEAAEADERPRKRGKTAMEQNRGPAAQSPRKRGRLRKSTDAPPEAQQQQRHHESSTVAPARRGRPRKEDAGTRTGEAAEAIEEQAPKRKRGRPSLQRREEGEESRREQQQPEPAASEQAPKRKRGRPSLPKAPGADEPPEEPQEDGEASRPAHRRKRGRPSLEPQDAEQQEETVPSASRQEQRAFKPRKRGRPSLQGISAAQVQNKTGKARRKPEKPPRDEVAEDAAEPSRTQPEEGRRRKSKPTAEHAIGRKGVPRHDQPGPKPPARKRRRSSQGEDAERQDDRPPSPSKPYARIVPQVRRVRQSTIAAKWAPLSGPSLPAVSTLLHLAHRPILQRLSNTHQRREHTSAALRLITHRIARKVTRGLPFPPASMPSSASPASAGAGAAASGAGRRRQTKKQQQQQTADGGRETELDFEAVLDAKAALERQLGPAAHAVELLRREKEHVEQELERDYEMLRALEAGARAQAREQRALLKKAHPLAPESVKPEPHDADAEDDHRIFAKTFGHAPAPGGIFSVCLTNNDPPSPAVQAAAAAAANLAAQDPLLRDKGEDVAPLVLQLGGHVESMRANLAQADGLVPQLERGRGALLAALLGHLDRDQYERVVLGG